MRLPVIAALLLTSASAFAQPAIRNLIVNPSYGTALVRFQIGGSATGQPNIYVRYGTDNNIPLFNGGRNTWPLTLPADYPVQTMPLGALQANTKYYILPIVANSSGSEVSNWNCNSAEGGIRTEVDGVQVGCDASGLGWFQTQPLPPNYGTIAEVPTPDVSVLPQAPPEATLPPLTVRPGDTADFLAKMATCASNTNGNAAVQEVLLPGGSVYKVEASLPVKTGSGLCIVRTADMTKLPPNGIRVSPDFAPFMATLMLPVTSAGQNDFSAIINANNATQGWYFLGIRFTVEPGRSATQQVFTITDVSDDGTVVTVTPPHNYTLIKPWTIHQIWGVQGRWPDTRGPNGTYENYVFAGVDKIRIFRPYGLTCPSSPCYQGGGKIRLSVDSSVCNASNETPIVVTTCQEHGIVDNAAIPIYGIRSHVLTVPAWHNVGNSNGELVMLIENSSVPEWNGMWVLNGTASETMTLNGGPSTACSDNCGTIRRLDPIHIKGIDGNNAANGTSYYRVLSPTTLQLLSKTGNGEYKGGGVLAQEPVHWYSMFSVGTATRRIHLDRCLFQPGGWPARTTFAVFHQGSESAIINSYFDDLQFFHHIRPITNRRAALDTFSTNLYYIATTTAIDTSAGDTKLFQNNYIDAHGISMYAQDTTTAPMFRNGVIRRNTFFVSDSKRAGSPTSDGLYYAHRHHLEWKRGLGFIMDGNRFINGWIDYNACGPMIMATPRRGDPIGDLIFTNNTIQGGTSGLYLLGIDDNATSLTQMVRRIWFENNIFTDMDGFRVSDPHDDAVNPAMCGYPLYVRYGVESFMIRHNVFRWSRGRRTQTFAFAEGKGAGLRITDNILWYTNDENEGPLFKAGFGAATGSGLPYPTGNVRNVFDTLWSHSTFSNNIVVPGVRNSGNAQSYDSKSGTDTLFRSDCLSYFTGFTGVYCAGRSNGGDSANERTASLRFFDVAGNNFRLGADSPAMLGSILDVDNSSRINARAAVDGGPIGVDQDKLDAAQGAVSNVHESNVTNSSATITYVAPDSDACYVDFAQQPLGSSAFFERKSDGGGASRTRNVELTGLTTSTTYYYRVLCAVDQPTRTFQTR